MVLAHHDFLHPTPYPAWCIAFWLTSHDDGPARHGTVVVCETLTARGDAPPSGSVGEANSVKQTAPMLKNGRRRPLSGKLTVKGVQGHIAYPHMADNPIHRLAPALAELVSIRWDEGNAFFPPTSWQVSNIHAGTGASNVIPGDCVVDFNFRFCTESTPESLKQRLTAGPDQPGPCPFNTLEACDE